MCKSLFFFVGQWRLNLGPPLFYFVATGVANHKKKRTTKYVFWFLYWMGKTLEVSVSLKVIAPCIQFSWRKSNASSNENILSSCCCFMGAAHQWSIEITAISAMKCMVFWHDNFWLYSALREKWLIKSSLGLPTNGPKRTYARLHLWLIIIHWFL